MDSSFRSLKGKLLLDSGQLGDTIFHQAAVYLCGHDNEGAMGLIVNHPFYIPFKEFMKEGAPSSLGSLPVHIGGPVLENSIFALFHPGMECKGLKEISGHVYLITSLEEASLEEAKQLDHAVNERNIHLYAGYAGWSSGQLEEEIARGAWLISDVLSGELFEEDPTKLWKKKIRTFGVEYNLLSCSPRRYSDN